MGEIAAMLKRVYCPAGQYSMKVDHGSIEKQDVNQNSAKSEPEGADDPTCSYSTFQEAEQRYSALGRQFCETTREIERCIELITDGMSQLTNKAGVAEAMKSVICHRDELRKITREIVSNYAEYKETHYYTSTRKLFEVNISKVKREVIDFLKLTYGAGSRSRRYALSILSRNKQQLHESIREAAALEVRLEFAKQEVEIKREALEKEAKAKFEIERMKLENEAKLKKLSLENELAEKQAVVKVCEQIEREENPFGINEDVKRVDSSIEIQIKVPDLNSKDEVKNYGVIRIIVPK